MGKQPISVVSLEMMLSIGAVTPNEARSIALEGEVTVEAPKGEKCAYCDSPTQTGKYHCPSCGAPYRRTDG